MGGRTRGIGLRAAVFLRAPALGVDLPDSRGRVCHARNGQSGSGEQSGAARRHLHHLDRRRAHGRLLRHVQHRGIERLSGGVQREHFCAVNLSGVLISHGKGRMRRRNHLFVTDLQGSSCIAAAARACGASEDPARGEAVAKKQVCDTDTPPKGSYLPLPRPTHAPGSAAPRLSSPRGLIRRRCHLPRCSLWTVAGQAHCKSTTPGASERYERALPALSGTSHVLAHHSRFALQFAVSRADAILATR